MNQASRNNFFIITGGPGSGKSSLIDALRDRGYTCVDEVARQIIRNQIEIGGDAIHTKDQIKFRDLMLAESIRTYGEILDHGPVFFDRGIPDLLGYCRLIKCDVPDQVRNAIERYHYNQLVFIAPPWEEIYQHDAERKQDWAEAVATYQNISDGYVEAGYALIELPKVSVDDRVEFVLQSIRGKYSSD